MINNIILSTGNIGKNTQEQKKKKYLVTYPFGEAFSLLRATQRSILLLKNFLARQQLSKTRSEGISCKPEREANKDKGENGVQH